MVLSSYTGYHLIGSAIRMPREGFVRRRGLTHLGRMSYGVFVKPGQILQVGKNRQVPRHSHQFFDSFYLNHR